METKNEEILKKDFMKYFEEEIKKGDFFTKLEYQSIYENKGIKFNNVGLVEQFKKTVKKYDVSFRFE